MQAERATIRDEIDLIVDSGVLGRSPIYVRLLHYLATATSERRVASEVDIATDVFGKGGDFDSNQDSSVRVYVHNLRQRLDRFYEQNTGSGNRISIPKGEYRLHVGTPDSLDLERVRKQPSKRTRPYLWLAVAILALGNFVLLGIIFTSDDSEKARMAQTPLWQPILQADRPLLVVVGDYFIFGELDSYGRVSRMVREFNVNSPEDLSVFKDLQSSQTNQYMNLDLSYLPQSAAFALNDVLSVVHTQSKQVNVIPASKLRTSDLKSNDVLYVGYLSGLGILEPYVFAASQLQIGTTYDELLNPDSGRIYLSNAGIPGRRTYQDFAFLASFAGPGTDNHVLVAAGTRDAGLMFAAEALSSEETLHELANRKRRHPPVHNGGYEALYRVVGSDRTSLDANLVHDGTLDVKEIWAQQH